MEISLKGNVAVVTGASQGLASPLQETYSRSGRQWAWSAYSQARHPQELDKYRNNHEGRNRNRQGDVGERKTSRLIYQDGIVDKFGKMMSWFPNAAVSIVKPLHFTAYKNGSRDEVERQGPLVGGRVKWFRDE